MNRHYRLAVVRHQDGDLAVAERDGRLLPLHLLTGAGHPHRDLAPIVEDWGHWSAVLGQRLDAAQDQFDVAGLDAGSAAFRPLLSAPGKLICIGANYHDHIAEMPIPVTPTYPYSFLKPANNTLRGSGEPVAAPRGVEMFDWEAELAVVIGREARHVAAGDALSIVAGYCNFNDLSARDWLASRPGIGVDWVRHKAFDGFAPIGPYLLPAEFVPDPQALPIRLSVNGAVKQDSVTGKMVYGVAEIIAHLTSIMTLFPGDIIATGTPAGVSHGHQPPEYLKAGDEIRMSIEGLGELVTPIVAEA
jgi:2-keto-4-pentenoate hydratase/2-oxohepta-3-ene-1,7-dioic acid hydratase in catechol pathway